MVAESMEMLPFLREHVWYGPSGVKRSWERFVSMENRVCVLTDGSSVRHFYKVGLPLWKAMTVPNGNGVLLTLTWDKAYALLGLIKGEIQGAPFQRLVPPRKTIWRRDVIKLANGHVIRVRRFGSMLTGNSFDYAICVDALGEETAFSRFIRSRQTSYFYDELVPRMNAGSQLVVVGERLKEASLYEALRTDSTFDVRE